jgi:NAD(P)H-dependent flavin oxidoreductase YrpB (nitropropane dioxygenase family)
VAGGRPGRDGWLALARAHAERRLKTTLTELLGIEAPIIQGSLGPWSSVGLTAAICEAGPLGQEVVEAIGSGRGHEYLPFSGQTVGMIEDVLPAREIVHSLVEGAARAIAHDA